MTDGAFEPVRLDNYVDGRDVGHRVVRCEDRLWYVKGVNNPAALGRELLAPRLGAGVVNVVDTRRVTDPSGLIKSDGTSWTAENPYELMSRLVDSYALQDLPITDPDRAVAFELVFSLWIRRRDTHAGNKAYVENVPVFFDHGVAFDGEQGYEDIGRFLDPTEDAGHAGRWRLRKLEDGQVIDLTELREEHRRTQLATHYVIDLERTDAGMDDAVSWVEGLTEAQIRQTADEALLSAEHAGAVANLLLATQSTLAADLDRLREVLRSGG